MLPRSRCWGLTGSRYPSPKMKRSCRSTLATQRAPLRWWLTETAFLAVLGNSGHPFAKVEERRVEIDPDTPVDGSDLHSRSRTDYALWPRCDRGA